MTLVSRTRNIRRDSAAALVILPPIILYCKYIEISIISSIKVLLNAYQGVNVSYVGTAYSNSISNGHIQGVARGKDNHFCG